MGDFLYVKLKIMMKEEKYSGTKSASTEYFYSIIILRLNLNKNVEGTQIFCKNRYKFK